MDKASFDELLESVRWAGKMMRDEPVTGGRVTVYEPNEVKRVRELTGLSQAKFAQLIHVSKGTLVNWEQGRRTPSGPAKALLTALANDPAHVVRAVQDGKDEAA